MMNSQRLCLLQIVCLFLILECSHGRLFPFSPTKNARSSSPSSLEIPRGGDKHHRPERGHELSSPVKEDEVYQAWKTIQKEYEEKAFGNQKWKLMNSKDGVQVSLLTHPNDPSCPYVKMTCEMPISLKNCWDFLLLENWDKNMPKMDPFFEGVSIHGEWNIHNTHMLLCRKRTKRIMAFGKRDLVFLSVTDEPLEDGTWVSGSVSVKTDLVPRDKKYTRAFQDSIAFYKPVADNKCAVTIMCRIDLNDSSEDGAGGFIPMWMYVKTIGRTGVMSVLKMRDAILDDLKERATKLGEEGHL